MGKRLLSIVFIIILAVTLPVFSYAVDPPSGTEILEYIEATGEQYIDSLFIPNGDTRLVATFKLTQLGSNNFLGQRRTTSSQVFSFSTVDDKWRCGYDDGSHAVSAADLFKHTVDINKNRFYLDGSLLYEFPYADFDGYRSLVYFYISTSYPGYGLLYDSQIYDIGTLVRDFIPVRMNGNVGLWDRVEGKFYGNSGTGTLTAGPVVSIIAPEYSISVSTDGNGSASSDLSVATAGTTVTLSVSPNDGYEFSEWQVLEGDIDIVNNQFIMPGSNVSVKAIFVPDGTHSVTVENDGYGVGSANPVRAEQGTRITLSAVPVLGYEFDSWEVVSGSVNISNNQFIMPDSDVVVRAKFKPIVYTIILNQGSNGSATVSQNTAIVGDIITLTATPDELYSFSYWNVTQGGITIENNQFVMPASNVVLLPVFIEQSAISSGFEYHSGAISGEEESEFALIDVDFGEQPAGEYLINIYHWGSGCIPTFQISYNGKYLPFSTTGGVSTVAIEHDGGSLVLDGSLDLVKNLLQTAEGTIVWAGEYGNGNLQYHSVSSWTFNIEDVVLIPVGISDTEDYGIYSGIISFFKDIFPKYFSKQEEAYQGATSPELSESVNEANQMIEQENQFMEDINTQIGDYSTAVDPGTVIDGIEGSDSVFSSMLWVGSIFSAAFGSMGMFQFIIYVPMILGVVCLVIGRGAAIAGRRPRYRPDPIKKGSGN